jgi:2-polyprenyl-3-methyl-5-hydroxy-6-metoxy-1,4-benzoquinol methylase
MSDPSQQLWHPESYAARGRFVSDLGAPVLELLDPGPDERVLDLGCGDGALTEQLVARGARVIGVDGIWRADYVRLRFRAIRREAAQP